MKKLLTIAMLAFACSALAEPADTLAPRLQKTAVTIHSKAGQGSGSIITRDNENYVLTAGHVVEDNRTIDQVIEDGRSHPSVSFKPVTVVQEVYRDGQSVGKCEVEADVIAYSSAEYGHDIALLHMRKSVTQDSIEFDSENLVPVGSELVHVGSLEGQEGSNSFTVGNCSQIGRVLYERVFDQSSCPSFPGSSGGSISLKSTGAYVGMLVRGAGETFNLYVPLRRIRQWASVHHVEFIFDPSAKPDLSKVRLEDREPTAVVSPELSGAERLQGARHV